MTGSTKMRFLAWAILSAALFLAGCTYHINHDIQPVLTRRPLVESLPLSVGLYLSPEFRTYRSDECESAFPLGTFCHEYNNLGPQSVLVFENILTALFDHMVVIDSMPPTGSNLKTDGIISPAISDFSAKGVGVISYRLTLFSPAGTELGMWEVSGVGRTGSIFVSGLVRVAMRDVAAKFVKGFRKEPVVIRWLEEAGVRLLGPTESTNMEGVGP